MRRKRFSAYIIGLLLAFVGSGLTSSCGTIRTHWGMEHEYQYDFPDGGSHKHHKVKKHKNQKKHHHDDDD